MEELNEMAPGPTAPSEEALAAHRQAQYDATHPASWVWDNHAIIWRAPVDPPADGLPYLWDEEAKCWTPFPGFPMIPSLRSEV